MDNSRLQYLFERYFDKTASAKESTELAELIGIQTNREQLIQLISAAWSTYQGDGVIVSAEKSDEMLKNILGKSRQRGKIILMNQRKQFKWWAIAAAAAVLLFVVGIYWLISNNKEPSAPPIAKTTDNDVNPGSFKAQLTLSDGRIIILDSAAMGELAKQGNTSVINKDGHLVYQPEIGSQESVVYNTIATNKGETFSVILSDGSKVWLNSSSSIHFPVNFLGKERRIEVTGEVYVKVAKNAAQPFIATFNGMEVLAIGTEFNINAYGDEDILSTTLIEGKVKVSKATSNTILNPGQQTQLYKSDQFSVPRNVDVNEIVAWKEGLFQFEKASLKTILREFARWYNVEVVYEGAVPQDDYFVIISRNVTLSSVLKALQASGVKFYIEGKKLIVQPG
ncbi:MAG: FecR domain-containing protein [Bacteroidota bacterium]|nr:FecR domain-containing protein [Bacteroidota bacterium]